MDLVIGLLWLSAFSVIVLFLGALNYFIERSHSDIKITESQPDKSNQTQQQQQQQSNRCANRRKQARKQRRVEEAAAAAVAALIDENLNDDNEDPQETKSNSSEKNIEEEVEEESSDRTTDEYEDPMVLEGTITPTEENQKPVLPIKQRSKDKPNSKSSQDESLFSSKPQASVAPVKQYHPSISTNNNQYSKSNKIYNHYSHSEYNSLPPRFQQRQQKEFVNGEKLRRRRIKTNSIANENDFTPMTSKHSDKQVDLSCQSSNQHGYSSESDNLTETSSTTAPQSTESQLSLKRSDFIRSLSSSNTVLEEFLSIFDSKSFSSAELDIILNKITNKYLLNKQDWQRSNKNEKTMERILEETYRSQAKILAIELQTEKNRVLELSKMNTDMDNTLRQFQQQPNIHSAQYQQTMAHYQMQIRRATDENARLLHQLHVYSTMPVTINELKQQQIILNEQLQQLAMKNSNLEKEIADGERASKHAAEIYKKADMQKQERIEQMMIDINKYKKIDRDLKSLQTKHNEFEQNLQTKLDDITHQRDDFKDSCNQLKDQVQEYEQLKTKYDELLSNQNQITNFDQLQNELNDVKTKNDLLRQRNWKIMEQLNQLTSEQEQNSSS